MFQRSWWVSSWTGRAVVATAVLKILAVAAQARTASSLVFTADRFINLAAVVLVVILVHQWTSRVAEGRWLWRVRRRLVLSYLLVGAVPILLLVAFALVGLLLVFFAIGSYLVQSRLAAATEQTANLARTTLIELERTPSDQRAEVVERRLAVLEGRYPGVSVQMVPTSSPRCGALPSKALVVPADVLPPWVSCEGFSGMLVFREGHALKLVARAAALPRRRTPDYAVLVDLPLDEISMRETLSASGIELGPLRLVTSPGDTAPPGGTDGAPADRTGSAARFLTTATVLTYTDWQHGLSGRAALSMRVNVGRLSRWLGAAQGGGNASFGSVVLILFIGVGTLLLVIEVVALANGLALARSITEAVDELFRGTERVKAGDYSQPIPERTGDQLGDLASSFNAMTRGIAQAMAERAEKERLEQELRIARDIQMSLLPQGPPAIAGCSLAAVCVPAREVGGDYYDYLPLADGRTALLIADVSGKGTSAALYMAELKGLMLSLSRLHDSPRRLLIEADRIMAHHLDSRSFITMIYAVIDAENRTITCARAGHTPFMRAATIDGDRRVSMLAPDGMVLGLNLDGGERFERALAEVALPLHSGDVYLFFTDGVSEAMSPDGGWFGDQRVADCLEAHADESAEGIRDRLLADLRAFSDGRPQHDDITMILLKVGADPP